jgi:hypothetical protein
MSSILQTRQFVRHVVTKWLLYMTYGVWFAGNETLTSALELQGINGRKGRIICSPTFSVRAETNRKRSRASVKKPMTFFMTERYPSRRHKSSQIYLLLKDTPCTVPHSPIHQLMP